MGPSLRRVAALAVALGAVAAAGPADAQEARIVLVEEADGIERLHHPVLIAEGRGFRIRCGTRAEEEAVMRGLGFLTVPSQLLSPLDPPVAAAEPSANPLLCPAAADYPITSFVRRGPDGNEYYLQFRTGYGSATAHDRVYVPGCAGLVTALGVDLAAAQESDPTPFFAGRIHRIACVAGERLPDEPRTFAEWCRRDNLAPADAATVRAILALTPEGEGAVGNAAACDRATEFLGHLTTLNLNGAGIASLAPLASLTHLSGLDLRTNAVADLSPLAQLRSLTTLHMTGNRVANVAALAPLAMLANLDLADNLVTDARPLSGLLTLRTLNLSGNRVASLAPLGDLPALEELRLARNGLTGDLLDPLTRLGALRLLDLSNNDIAASSALSAFPSTVTLILAGNPILAEQNLTFAEICVVHRNAATPYGETIRQLLTVADSQVCATAATTLTSRTTLDLSAKGVADLAPLTTLRQLTDLDLSGNDIVDVAPLARLSNLVRLDLAENNIVDIRPVGALKKLTSFTAASNPVNVGDFLSGCLMAREERVLTAAQLAEVAALRSLTPAMNCLAAVGDLRLLTDVDLRESDLTGVTYFPVLEQVRQLAVSGNGITDLGPLSSLRELQRLDAAENAVARLGALSGHPRLVSLDLASNPLSTLDGIAGMSRLAFVDLSATRVRDIAPLHQLPNLASARLRGVQVHFRTLADYCLVQRLDSFAVPEDIRPTVAAVLARAGSDGYDPRNCPEVTFWAENLPILNLNGQRLRRVDPLRFFVRVKELVLVDNQISDVEPLSQLEELVVLDASRNAISALPDIGLRLPKLRNLDLSQNGIESLPNLGDLPLLARLNLAGNRISNPPDFRSRSPQLETLQLDNNQIDDVATAQRVLPASLSGNPVCRLRFIDTAISRACGRSPGPEPEPDEPPPYDGSSWPEECAQWPALCEQPIWEVPRRRFPFPPDDPPIGPRVLERINPIIVEPLVNPNR